MPRVVVAYRCSGWDVGQSSVGCRSGGATGDLLWRERVLRSRCSGCCGGSGGSGGGPFRPGGRSHRSELVRSNRVRSGSSVGSVVGVPGGAVGSGPRHMSLIVDREVPAAFVDQVVMGFTQRQQVREDRFAAVGPPHDVMDPTRREGDAAVRVCAGGVHRFEHSSLLTVRGPQLCAHLVDRPVRVHDDGLDDRFAAQALHRGDRNGGAVSGFTHRVGVTAVAHRVDLGVDHDLRHTPATWRMLRRRP